ncbi:ABC transporter permease [[Mycoplasma] collis]|uniref:ABC transporter permease n=1 Tax=[Mycoplasma] collis TaxID=2127 RepID=UPI00051C164B|nr:ABC transporter permease [[Mycoplasma] collis]
MDAILFILVPAIALFCIISLSSLSGLFSEKVGIVNIAIESMIIIGATFYLMLSHLLKTTNPWFQIPLFMAASLATGLFALLHGIITIRLKGDHIISGVALNLLAPAIALILLKLVGVSNRFESNLNELALSSNVINDWKNIISFKLFLVIFIFIIAIVLLNKTKWGLRLKSIGENPQAADVAGINVNSFKWQGVFISGLLAGIAGSIFGQLRGIAFSANAEGLGFLALTVLIMSQWKPSIILVVSILFSLIYSTGLSLSTGQGAFVALKDYGKFFNALPFFITLIILFATSKKIQMPAALGIPYDKSLR